MGAERVLLAANWKLNHTREQALSWLRAVEPQAAAASYEVAVFPSYPLLPVLADARQHDEAVQVGGQDLFYEETGAFTGAVSGMQLRDAGCSWVLVGHSERRLYFGETLESSRLRLRAALQSGLRPLLCVGEQLAQRQTGSTERVVREQLQAAWQGLTVQELAAVTIAYEPVWAIGTGEVATPAQAAEVHAFIRGLLTARAPGLEGVRIVYGGSVKPENAAELLAQEHVDGVLVGGASLSSESFLKIAACA